MDDLAPFESAKQLIEGAKERLSELEPLCQAVGETRDCEIITYTDRKTNEKVVQIRLKQRFPPKIRRIASSIIKELRLSLDQALCDAAILLGRKDAKGVYFPFGKDPADLKREAERKCKNVNKDLVNYCLAFQPHYGGNAVLWTLSRLAGETHQRIIETALEDGASFARAFRSAVGPLQIIINKWDSYGQQPAPMSRGELAALMAAFPD